MLDCCTGLLSLSLQVCAPQARSGCLHGDEWLLSYGSGALGECQSVCTITHLLGSPSRRLDKHKHAGSGSSADALLSPAPDRVVGGRRVRTSAIPPLPVVSFVFRNVPQECN